MAVLRPLYGLMSELRAYNVLGLGIRAPTRRLCSIAQGCPLSMRLSLLTVPLVRLCTSLEALPRALADDWLIAA
eukprot:2925998-Alexandrium_andersonii.AAC.1